MKKADFGKRPALVLIDFAHACFYPDCPLHADVDAALASALRIRKLAHEVGIPVVLTEELSEERHQRRALYGKGKATWRFH